MATALVPGNLSIPADFGVAGTCRSEQIKTIVVSGPKCEPLPSLPTETQSSSLQSAFSDER